MKKNHKTKGGTHLSLTKNTRLPLEGFLGTQCPDSTCLKFVYSDYRFVTAAVNQAEYVYRLNSLFDPDFTGVGGQPDGFDQWKTLYSNYRVVAAAVEVQAAGGNGFGFVAIAPTSTSTTLASAEEAGGLRHARAGTFTQQFPRTVKALWHIGTILGQSDETVLTSKDAQAAVTASPTSEAFVHVCCETSGASDVVYLWTKITYYARMEIPTVLIDTAHRHRTRFSMALTAIKEASTTPVADQTAASAAAASTTMVVVENPPVEVTTSQLLNEQILDLMKKRTALTRTQSERTLGK